MEIAMVVGQNAGKKLLNCQTFHLIYSKNMLTALAINYHKIHFTVNKESIIKLGQNSDVTFNIIIRNSNEWDKRNRIRLPSNATQMRISICVTEQESKWYSWNYWNRLMLGNLRFQPTYLCLIFYLWYNFLSLIQYKCIHVQFRCNYSIPFKIISFKVWTR